MPCEDEDVGIEVLVIRNLTGKPYNTKYRSTL